MSFQSETQNQEASIHFCGSILDSLKNMLETYYSVIESACRLIFEDTEFEVDFVHRFNRTLLPIASYSNTVESCLKFDLSVYFVHKSSIVTDDKNLDFDVNHAIIFHLDECPLSAYPLLELKSRTANYLSCKKICLPSTAEMTVLKMDDAGQPRIYLSGQKLSKWWQDQRKILLAQLPGFNSSKESSIDTRINPDILVSILAFRLASWPASAKDWILRRRNWPSQDVVQRAASEVVVVRPFDINCDDLGTTLSCNTELLWQYDFANVEKVLLQELNGVQSMVYSICCAIVLQDDFCSSNDGIQSMLLMHAFFWTLEESPKELWSERSLTEACLQVFSTWVSFEQKGEFSHYFIPTLKLPLNKIPKFSNSWEDSFFRERIVKITKLIHALSLDQTGEEELKISVDNIRNKVFSQLSNSFEQSTHLLFLQLYYKLHATKCLDKSILYHLQFLNCMRTHIFHSSCSPDVRISIEAFVMCSLGKKYYVKALQFDSRATNCMERIELMERAEKCFIISVEMLPSSLSNQIALAQFYFSIGNIEKAIDRIKYILKHQMHQVTSDDEDKYETEVQGFRAALLTKHWLRASERLDIICCWLEKPFDFPNMDCQTFMVSFTQLLGCPKFSVTIIDASFHLHYLHVFVRWRNQKKLLN